jgi:hypothetical protein
MEVLTSDSPASAQRLLFEILEIRRQMQIFAGETRLPDKSTQILIFKSQDDFNAFVPKFGLGEKLLSGFFLQDDGGCIFVVVGGKDFESVREVVVIGYARYLLQSVVPRAPLWMTEGLPKFFSTTVARRDQVNMGAVARDHANNINPAKLLPLTQLMSDVEMAKLLDPRKHSTALYHESWALWHQWMTSGGLKRREQITRLLAALQRGEKGDAASVAAVFGQPLEEIEAAHRRRKVLDGWPHIVANEDAQSLAPGLKFNIASDLDIKTALAKLCGRTGKGEGSLRFEILQLGSQYQQSPRPWEALAILAAGTTDHEGSRYFWEKARDIGTTNAFAYLLPVRGAIFDRNISFSLKPELPDAFVEKMRGLLDRTLELDPGQPEARYYRSYIEAFAPVPRKEILDEIQRGGDRYLRPWMFLTLAIARWRLGDHAAAHRLLEECEGVPYLASNLKQAALELGRTMQTAEQGAAK